MCRAERIECKYTRTSGYLYPVEDTWKHNKTLEKELEVCLSPVHSPHHWGSHVQTFCESALKQQISTQMATPSAEQARQLRF